MKVILLGISIILFGMTVTMATTGPQTLGLGISFAGLVVSFYGFSKKEEK